ncbi:hypothetical protein CDL15_Pgr026597 [Punica granatum]|uniref:RNase H type-1 domain-containing protein n=1 Tax=Punica granatum TaxID=22663 RepID=A0A218WLY6_PUNGR|nr:hypothetical protein CDL15_Pgr026597 [Punica granatum]
MGEIDVEAPGAEFMEKFDGANRKLYKPGKKSNKKGNLSKMDQIVVTPGPAGASGIIRDEHGNWVSGFMHNNDFASSVAAELWGVLSSLNVARSLGLPSSHSRSGLHAGS